MTLQNQINKKSGSAGVVTHGRMSNYEKYHTALTLQYMLPDDSAPH